MSSRSTKGENVSRGRGLGVMNGYWGEVFEMQQNKSGLFSLAFGSRGQPTCQLFSERSGAIWKSASSRLFCTEAFSITDTAYKKAPCFRMRLFRLYDAWQFPTLAWGGPTLPSALRRFTSEFGMGSGGTTALQPPGKFCSVHRFRHERLSVTS